MWGLATAGGDYIAGYLLINCLLLVVTYDNVGEHNSDNYQLLHCVIGKSRVEIIGNPCVNLEGISHGDFPINHFLDYTAGHGLTWLYLEYKMIH